MSQPTRYLKSSLIRPAKSDYEDDEATVYDLSVSHAGGTLRASTPLRSPGASPEALKARQIALGIVRETYSFLRSHDVMAGSSEHMEALDFIVGYAVRHDLFATVLSRGLRLVDRSYL